jgi:lysozyme
MMLGIFNWLSKIFNGNKMTAVQLPQKALGFIMAFEGLSLNAYPDPGTRAEPFTIGYGSTEMFGAPVKPGMTIDKEDAMNQLTIDATSAMNEVLSVVTVPLNVNQLSALTDFVYNEGIGNFEKSTMLKYINESNFAAAAVEFPKWDMAADKVMSGLLNRRMTEQSLFTQAV